MEARRGWTPSTRSRNYEAPATIFATDEVPGEIFGPNVFTKAVMQKRLPKPVFKSLMATIEHSKPLDPTVADVVAVGHEGLGHGEGGHPLRPRLLPADPPHRREARQLLRARWGRLRPSPSSRARP